MNGKNNKTSEFVGQKFGRLTVISVERKNKRKYFYCKCDCGNEKEIRADGVLSGRVQSCGCLYKESRLELAERFKVDHSGERFGRLTVINRLDKKNKYGVSYYKCKCDCGNITNVLISNLLKGNTTSCGCVQKEAILKSRDDAKKTYKQKYLTDKTSIPNLDKKLYKNSKSGVTGVYYNKKARRWIAHIGFKKVEKIYLGSFDSLEDAKLRREVAEEILFKPVLENDNELEIKSEEIEAAEIRDLVEYTIENRNKIENN